MQVTEKKVLKALGAMALSPEIIGKQLGIMPFKKIEKDGKEEVVPVLGYKDEIAHVRRVVSRMVQKGTLETVKVPNEITIKYQVKTKAKVTQGRKSNGDRRISDEEKSRRSGAKVRRRASKARNASDVPDGQAVQESAPKDQGSSEQA